GSQARGGDDQERRQGRQSQRAESARLLRTMPESDQGRLQGRQSDVCRGGPAAHRDYRSHGPGSGRSLASAPQGRIQRHGGKISPDMKTRNREASVKRDDGPLGGFAPDAREPATIDALMAAIR